MQQRLMAPSPWWGAGCIFGKARDVIVRAFATEDAEQCGCPDVADKYGVQLV